MVKLTGPMHSDSASGTFANSQVHAKVKGVSYARVRVIPRNPQTGTQGDVRLIVGGLGRAASAIKATSAYAGQLTTLELVPAALSKQSWFVKTAKALYMQDATAFEAVYTAFQAHTAKADFETAAADLGIADFDISYKSTAHSFSNGMMLYVIAKLAIDNSFSGAPYTTALSSWTSSEIGQLAADLAAV